MFLVLLVVTVVLVYLYWPKFKHLVGLHERPEELFKHPPGPFALPILGNIFLLGSKLHLNLTKLADIYGDIYSLRLGSRGVVVLNSVQLARETLVQNARHFSDRPPFHSFQVNSRNGQSIAFGNTGQWYSYHKKFASRALNKMYENVERFHQIARDEILNLKNILNLEHSSEPIDPTSLIKDLVFNFSCRLVFGDNVPGTFGEDSYHIVEQSSILVKNNSIANPVDFFPWLALLFKKKTRKLQLSVERLMEFVERIHRVCRSDTDHDGRMCIAKALKSEELSGQALRDDSMVQILADLFGAGLETVSTTMTWAVAFLASNTRLQEEVHAELQSAIGKSNKRPPSLEDKSKMPLLQATVLEVLRMSSVLPLGLPHYCSEDTIVSGYKIEKGAVVLINIWAINHDPNSFDQPDIFNPYRFLDPITRQLVTDDWMSALPFSTGTRKCLGATVAKSELFLLLAGLLHNFAFDLRGRKVDLDGVFGLTLRPHPFNVYVHKRF